MSNFNWWIVFGPLFGAMSFLIGWKTIYYTHRQGVRSWLSAYTFNLLAAIAGFAAAFGFAYLVVRDSFAGIVELCGRDQEGTLFFSCAIVIGVFVAFWAISCGLVHLGRNLNAKRHLGRYPAPDEIQFPNSWLQPKVDWVCRGFAPLVHLAHDLIVWVLDRILDLIERIGGSVDDESSDFEPYDDLDEVGYDEYFDEPEIVGRRAQVVEPCQAAEPQVIELSDIRRVMQLDEMLRQCEDDDVAVLLATRDGMIRAAKSDDQVIAEIATRTLR